MKNVKVLFCFEMLTVLIVCVRGYVRWEWPLYLSIGIGVLAVVLLYYFHYQYRKSEGKKFFKQ
ncbi:hypothetical protein CN326_21775 [Bacillus sp. AFS018417]|uniref:hypothetical protein n=1 Tax=Bacillus sp. AFS018417 TaxID=2033491 RepID=UPI000BF5B722|nr:MULTISPECIES: hypothetical protein [unclassified Bacillus (in: firmicutes)]MCP1125554.1 hypothetical protein [Bacillus sp. 3103sda1]PEZ01145.1 hypothetical protein CN326_21775 [Bacillus sp. AFS018417]